MRDLNADLKICEAATPGPYRIRRDDVGDEHTCIVPIEIIAADGSKIVAYEGGLAPDENWTARQLEANAKFIAAARTGWPEAIKRAMAAEEELQKALEIILALNAELIEINRQQPEQGKGANKEV